MKCKKYLIGLLCLVVLLFAGCSSNSFYIKPEDGNYSVNVGETVTLLVYEAGDNVTRKADVKITSDNTGGTATLTQKGGKCYLTATSEGTVTVSASYETLFDEYHDSLTITFVDREAELDRFTIDVSYYEENGRGPYVYQGDTVWLSVEGSNKLFTIDQDAVEYELTKNTAGATLSGRTLTATKPGAVTVKATYTMEGRTYTDTYTIAFNAFELHNENPKITAKVGDAARLSCVLDPEYLSENINQYLTCEITGGSGKVGKDENGYYITSTEAGTVEYTLRYVNGDLDLSATGKVVFKERSVNITVESTSVYVGYTVKLSASSDDIEGFNPSAENIQYQVLSGDATVSGNELVVNKPGDVKVQATYLYNGAQVKSNILTLYASYDGNYIVSVEQLRNLTDSTETYNLGADLDLSGYENWEPITNFRGTLRGHGYTISGLNITASNLESEKGLFATLSGTVENLNIDGTITASGEVEFIGLLCGKNTGTIKDVTVSGTVTAQYSTYVGGIAGWSDNAYITGCTNEATVWGRYTVGGIAGGINTGRSTDGKIENNSNEGSIIGENDVGGIFGYAGGGTILVYNHKNEGEVTGSGSKVGGLIGHGKDGMTITSCTNTADISGEDYVGGVIGYGESGVSEISFCTNSGAITGNLYVGGYAGYSTGTTMSNLTNSQIITGKAWVGGIAGYTGKIGNCTNDGTLTITGVHVQSDNTKVSYVGGIAGFATSAHNCVNNSDITLNSAGNYVAGVVGYISATRSDDATLFAKNKNHGAITSSGSYVGGVFGAFVSQGNNNSVTITITDNSNDGEITGENYVGGIIGCAKGEFHSTGYNYAYKEHWAWVKVTSCENAATVNGNDYVGGILGNGEKYMITDEVVWNTNTFTGTLTAEGDNQGDYYGKIA